MIWLFWLVFLVGLFRVVSLVGLASMVGLDDLVVLVDLVGWFGFGLVVAVGFVVIGFKKIFKKYIFCSSSSCFF